MATDLFFEKRKNMDSRFRGNDRKKNKQKKTWAGRPRYEKRNLLPSHLLF